MKGTILELWYINLLEAVPLLKKGGVPEGRGGCVKSKKVIKCVFL